MRRRRKGVGKKLLVASVGVAAVTYVAACSSDDDSGTNTSKDAGTDTNQFDVVANLVAPDTGTGGSGGSGGTDAGQDAPADVNQLDVVANLVAPDTGTD